MSDKRKDYVTMPSDPSGYSDVVRELREAQQNIAAIEGVFNQVEDEKLLDAFIYELKAQRTRYSYLLQQARLHG